MFPPGSDSLRRRNRHQRARLEKAHLRSGGGATICCLYLSGERSRHFPARVAPPPFAPLRGAPSRTDWLGASGRLPTPAVAAVWWPAQAGHQRRTGQRTRLALIRLTYRSQISELALCSFFFFRCAGQGAFRRRKVVREGGRAENDCRYVQQVLKDAARRDGSENQGAVAQFSTGPERQVAGHQSSGFAAAHTPSGRGSSHAPDWDWDSD